MSDLPSDPSELKFKGIIMAVCRHAVDIGCYKIDTMDCEPKYFCKCCSNYFCGPPEKRLCSMCDR